MASGETLAVKCPVARLVRLLSLLLAAARVSGDIGHVASVVSREKRDEMRKFSKKVYFRVKGEISCAKK